MLFFMVIAGTLFSSGFSTPQQPPAALSATVVSTPVPIINQSEEISPNGSFKYSYETGNGIKVEQSGYLKANPENATDQIQVIEGNISYTDTEGKLISLRYVADEKGYQPVGEHLPTLSPLTEELSRQVLARNEQQPDQTVGQPVAREAEKYFELYEGA